MTPGGVFLKRRVELFIIEYLLKRKKSEAISNKKRPEGRFMWGLGVMSLHRVGTGGI